MRKIRFYSSVDAYEYLTNFYDRVKNNDPNFHLVIDGIDFQSSEHAYQALKFVTEDFDDNELQQEYYEIISEQSTPYKTKILGHQQTSGGRYEWQKELIDIAKKYKKLGVIPSPDWEDIKVNVMEWIVNEKFNQNPHLKKRFMNDTTVDDIIIEASNYDYFWGEGKNRSGENQLGKIMMRLRQKYEDELNDQNKNVCVNNLHIQEKSTGLILINEFLTEYMEQKLLDFLYDEEWVNVPRSTREVIHYGYEYPYSGKGKLIKTTKIPRIIRKLIRSIRHNVPQLENFHPDQVIVNKYEAGQGIGAHTDHEEFFGNDIVCVTLLSGVSIDFRYTQDSKIGFDVYARERSLYAMRYESRYEYTHQIEKRKTDTVNGKKIKRNTRISITFREVNQRYVK